MVKFFKTNHLILAFKGNNVASLNCTFFLISLILLLFKILLKETLTSKFQNKCLYFIITYKFFYKSISSKFLYIFFQRKRKFYTTTMYLCINVAAGIIIYSKVVLLFNGWLRSKNTHIYIYIYIKFLFKILIS